MAEQKIIGFDYDTVSQDGSDNITASLLELLNSYPALEQAPIKQIQFQVLDTTKGIAMFANPNVAIMEEFESITGHVRQTCAYAFTIVYRTRADASKKAGIKEWLDNLGRWIEKAEYPALAGDRYFKKITRTSQSYLYGTTDDKAEDWSISLQATYHNEFDR
jgi:hypothetical protein